MTATRSAHAQQQRLGHRGRGGNPLYGARKLLVIRDTASDPELQQRLEALLALGDPDGEVAFAYSIKEAVSRLYETEGPAEAEEPEKIRTLRGENPR